MGRRRRKKKQLQPGDRVQVRAHVRRTKKKVVPIPLHERRRRMAEEQGKKVEDVHWIDVVGDEGAPKKGEKGYKRPPWDGRDPAEIGETMIGNAKWMMDDPEFGMAWHWATSRMPDWGEDAEPAFKLEELLHAPYYGKDGKPLSAEEREDMAIWAVEVAMETDEARWSGKFEDLLPVEQRNEDLTAPMWLVNAVAADAIEAHGTYKPRLVNVSKQEAVDYVNEHHSMLPKANVKGLMYAIGVQVGDRLVAVATVGTPTGRWDRAEKSRPEGHEVDRHNVLELTRIASDGSTLGAASMLCARCIRLLDRSKRGTSDRPALFVTYSFEGEKGTTYEALRDMGLRPVEKRMVDKPHGKRKGSTHGRAQIAKIRWEAGRNALPARWDLIEPSRQVGLFKGKRLELVSVKPHVRKGRAVRGHRAKRQKGREEKPKKGGAPTVVELFAGAGGMAYGLKLAGFRSVALVEWNKHAAQTLRNMKAKQAVDGEVIEADVKDIDFTRWRGADVVTGGPPCQPYSKAGKQLGAKDKIDGWPTMIRAVREIRPRYMVAENVKGMMEGKFDETRASIVQQLEELGYETRWQKINAAEYGVPQARMRVLLWAWRKGEPPPKAMRKFGVSKMTAEMGSIGTGYPAETAQDLDRPIPSASNPAWLKKHRPRDPRAIDEPAQTVVAHHNAGNVHLVETWDLKPGSRVTVWEDPEPPTYNVFADASEELDGQGFDGFLDEFLETYGEEWGRGHVRGTVVEYEGGYVLVQVDGDPEPIRYPVQAVTDAPKRIMRASPNMRREWQTFPEQWDFAGPKTQVDRQIGNAVPPVLGEAIGWALRHDAAPPVRAAHESPSQRYADEIDNLYREYLIGQGYSGVAADWEVSRLPERPGQRDLFKASRTKSLHRLNLDIARPMKKGTNMLVDGYGMPVRILLKAEQLTLFGGGPREASVKGHTRTTKGGKVVPVKGHQRKTKGRAERKASAPRKPGGQWGEPEVIKPTRHDLPEGWRFKGSNQREMEGTENGYTMRVFHQSGTLAAKPHTWAFMVYKDGKETQIGKAMTADGAVRKARRAAGEHGGTSWDGGEKYADLLNEYYGPSQSTGAAKYRARISEWLDHWAKNKTQARSLLDGVDMAPEAGLQTNTRKQLDELARRLGYDSPDDPPRFAKLKKMGDEDLLAAYEKHGQDLALTMMGMRVQSSGIAGPQWMLVDAKPDDIVGKFKAWIDVQKGEEKRKADPKRQASIKRVEKRVAKLEKMAGKHLPAKLDLIDDVVAQAYKDSEYVTKQDRQWGIEAEKYWDRIDAVKARVRNWTEDFRRIQDGDLRVGDEVHAPDGSAMGGPRAAKLTVQHIHRNGDIVATTSKGKGGNYRPYNLKPGWIDKISIPVGGWGGGHLRKGATMNLHTVTLWGDLRIHRLEKGLVSSFFRRGKSGVTQVKEHQRKDKPKAQPKHDWTQTQKIEGGYEQHRMSHDHGDYHVTKYPGGWGTSYTHKDSNEGYHVDTGGEAVHKSDTPKLNASNTMHSTKEGAMVAAEKHHEGGAKAKVSDYVTRHRENVARVRSKMDKGIVIKRLIPRPTFELVKASAKAVFDRCDDVRGDAATESWMVGSFLVEFKKSHRGFSVLTITDDSLALPFHAVVPSEGGRYKLANDLVNDLQAGRAPKRGMFRAVAVPSTRYPGRHA